VVKTHGVPKAAQLFDIVGYTFEDCQLMQMIEVAWGVKVDGMPST
jgi:hypothetical protein